MLLGFSHPGDCPEDRPPLSSSPMGDDWKTYAEAGAFLGIKPESVKRRARARNWSRMVGNDGLARVKIPDLPRPGDHPPDNPGDESPPILLENPPLGERLAAAETEIRLLRERLDDLTRDRDALRDALARAASNRQPVEVRPGFWARLFGG